MDGMWGIKEREESREALGGMELLFSETEETEAEQCKGTRLEFSVGGVEL